MERRRSRMRSEAGRVAGMVIDGGGITSTFQCERTREERDPYFYFCFLFFFYIFGFYCLL